MRSMMVTGKSFSKALILASVNPQIQVQNMLCTKIDLFCSCFDIQNNIFTQHVVRLYFLGNSTNNLSSYRGLTDSSLRASEKDLPV